MGRDRLPRRSWPAAALGLLVATLMAGGTPGVGRAGPRPPWALTADALPGLASSTPLSLRVILAGRDPGGLAGLVAAVSTPGSPEFRHFLSRGQFAGRFGASDATVADVTRDLGTEGLTVGDLAPDRLSLTAWGPAGAVEQAFGVDLVPVPLPGGGSGFTTVSAPRLPSGVTAVLGLDDLTRATGEPQRAAPQSAPPTVPSGVCQAAAAPDARPPSAVAGAYDLGPLESAGATGAGRTVALFELADYAAGDLAAYRSCFGLGAQTITKVSVDGGAALGAGTSEVTFDIEQVMGLSPGAAIDVYEAPNGGPGIYDLYQKIVDDDSAQIVSTSWGLCEADAGSLPSAEATLFEQAASQGQTVLAASGDEGSSACFGTGTANQAQAAVSDPASQPDVTGVGGTSLSGTSPRQESAWNTSTPQAGGVVEGGAGGGGISSLWPTPSWQLAAAGSGASKREVPDVSASADPTYGYPMYCTAGDCATGPVAPGWELSGGTSMAAPLWASLMALAAHSCTGTPTFGLVNPVLYSSAGITNNITTGNNDYGSMQGGRYPATPGYNMATGLGSPIGARVAAALCQAGSTTPPAATAPNVGPSTPTTRVAGADRVLTSVAASQASFPASGSAQAVVLARDDQFPDALAGVPLAVHVGGPVLLTAPGALDPRTLTEIRRVLPAGRPVYLLGGTSALSASIASELATDGYDVVRYGGADRYATAVTIASSGLGDPATIFEASGSDFPDAVSAGPAAAAAGGAILLTAGNRPAPETVAYTAEHSSDRRIAIGGPAAAADPGADAIVGADRYATSALVAARFFSNPAAAGLATGAVFPDALSGGPVVARRPGPVLLTDPNLLPGQVRSYLDGHRSSLQTLLIFGGSNAVSPPVASAAEQG
jgi:putative cell wall-binding protein